MQTQTSLSSQLSARERGLTTAVLDLGLITFAIEASNTTLILPQIMTNLRVEVYQIHWVLTAAGIVRTVATAATGWLSGRFGPRPLYLLCIGSMTIGALGSMLAWDWPSLIFFRMLAGAGGGLIPQISQAIFYQIFPPGKRGMALGFALMGWSIGPAFGPFMGGNLLAFASWRVVYGISLPLCGLGLILAWWLLPNLRRPERRRLDYYGALTTTVVISTLLLALSQGNREGWHSQYILTLLGIAGGAAVVWVVVELWFNALVAIFCLFPALPLWRRRKYQAPSTSYTATVSVQSAAVSKGDPNRKGLVTTLPPHTLLEDGGARPLQRTSLRRCELQRQLSVAELIPLLGEMTAEGCQRVKVMLRSDRPMHRGARIERL